MTLTQSELAEVSKSESKGSKGRPARMKTKSGRKASSKGGYQHGLRAKTVPLKNEGQEIADRGDQWHEFYQPISPAACHYANEAARGTVLLDRADRYLQATLDKQVAAADALWRTRRQRQVADNRRKLSTDPAAGVAGLMKTGLGVRYLIGQFEELRAIVVERGYLLPEECTHAICHFGVNPGPQEIAQIVIAYVTNLYNLGCTPGVSVAVLKAMTAPENRPVDMRELDQADVFVAPGEASREMLLETIDNELGRLRAEEKLRTGPDAESRKQMLDEASVLDDAALRRYNRCHSEARISVDRAVKGLNDALDRDSAESESKSETEAVTPVVAAAPEKASVLPSEPRTAVVEPQPIVEETRSSGDTEAPVSGSSFDRRAAVAEAPRRPDIAAVAGPAAGR